MNASHANNSTTLVCWIGDTDILTMAHYGKTHDIPVYYNMARRILEADKAWDKATTKNEIDKLNPEIRDSSILLTLGDNSEKADIPVFTHVLLLTNRPSKSTPLFEDFKNFYHSFVTQRLNEGKTLRSSNGNINFRIEFVSSPDDPNIGVDPWNYSAVYEATKKVLENIECPPENIWYNITPGTIAQQTTLIFLGKERLPQTENFMQVDKSRRKVSQCAIPFDVRHIAESVIEARARQIESDDIPLIGNTKVFKAAKEKAERAAQYPVTILLTGESGTGKEVFARHIHERSGRSGAFIPINCSMLSRETGVTELTGYFKGAFTGAEETTSGYYEKAKGGTLFLDEIGDCPLEVQAELLRFLQPIGNERPTTRHWRLKGTPSDKVSKDEKKYVGEQVGDILVIAATNRNVRDAAIFRQDLFYRLETISIEIPSLEERKREFDAEKGIDDIRDLADDFLLQCNEAFGFPQQQFRHFASDAYEALRSHVWRGNVRELKNAVTRMVVLNGATTLTADIVRASLNKDAGESVGEQKGTLEELVGAMARQDATGLGKNFDERMSDIRRIYCQAALEAAHGNKKKAYTAIKLNPKTFEEYLK